MIPRALFRASLTASPRITHYAAQKYPSYRPAFPISLRLHSRATFQTLIRAQPTSRSLQNPIPHQPSARIPSVRFQRFKSEFQPPRRPDKIIYTKFDPEKARNAKPLLTVEQISHVAFHSSTKVIIVVSGVGAVIFYVSNLEEVPVSGRKRFNCYSDKSVEAQGAMMYEKIMRDSRGSILPGYDPRVRKVHRVMERLIPASGAEDSKWELHVIESNGISVSPII